MDGSPGGHHRCCVGYIYHMPNQTEVVPPGLRWMENSIPKVVKESEGGGAQCKKR